MALSWSIRRQLLYYAVGIVVLLVLLFSGWQKFFTAAPTCFDGKQNGTETGVDCGGSCALICSSTARDPVVLWARSFQTGPHTYTAAAYVQNPNQGAGAKQVPYSFQLFDDKNLLVVEQRGVIDLPPTQTIPIVEPNINVGNRTVLRTLFTFFATPTWYKIYTDQIPTLSVTGQTLANDGSRLSATLVNSTLNDISGVSVAAVLFDVNGVARAASKSIVGRINRKSSQTVVFTWPGGVPGIVRAEITLLPSF